MAVDGAQRSHQLRCGPSQVLARLARLQNGGKVAESEDGSQDVRRCQELRLWLMGILHLTI